MNDRKDNKLGLIKIPAAFLFARLVLVLSLPLEGLKSYGDFWNFFYLAELGRPFLDIWVEFPPLFPFLSRGLYLLADGKEHTYIYLGVLFFSLIQAGSIYLFQQIAAIVWGENGGQQRTILYAFMVLGLFYGWAYFDCLAVFLMILGLNLMIRGKGIQTGLVLGLGGLVKWFPVLVLPAAWKWLGAKKAIRIVISTLLVIGLVWSFLYILSPSMTKASLLSQGAKGSWETIWAILDGNQGTGNFHPAVDRTDPETATFASGNPATLSPWITLIIFAVIGFFLFWKATIQSGRQIIAFSGFTVILFFLWSPGYSPQWVLFLLPLVLLSLENRRTILAGVLILLVNLLEWPLLLSRGLFQHLPALILLRTTVYLMIAVMFAGLVLEGSKNSEGNRS